MIPVKYFLLPADWVRSLLLRAPGDVIRPRGCAVLVHQLLDDFSRVVQLVIVVLEYVLFAELLQEGLTLTQFVILPASALEQLWDAKWQEIRLYPGKPPKYIALIPTSVKRTPVFPFELNSLKKKRKWNHGLQWHFPDLYLRLTVIGKWGLITSDSKVVSAVIHWHHSIYFSPNFTCGA